MLRNIIFASQGSNSLPIGTILPYVGALDKIPHGWFLCDGNNGTPDLRERFLEGASNNKRIGSFLEGGFPNIRGTFNAVVMGHRSYPSIAAPHPTGAFYTISHYPPMVELTDASIGHGYYYGFDASLYNSIFKDDVDCVQPAAYTVYFIMRIV